MKIINLNFCDVGVMWCMFGIRAHESLEIDTQGWSAVGSKETMLESGIFRESPGVVEWEGAITVCSNGA